MWESTARAISSFNYPREHESLVNVFKLKKGIGLFHEPKLQIAESSWHRQWIHTSNQVEDICKSHNLIRFEVENCILENKLAVQRKPHRDIEHILSCIHWIFLQIRKELPPARSVIHMRAEFCFDFKEIMKRSPGRFYPSVKEDYVNFLRKIYNTPEFEYLRYRRV